MEAGVEGCREVAGGYRGAIRDRVGLGANGWALRPSVRL